MVNSCYICRIVTGKDPNISFHRIPKKEDLKLKWYIVIGKEVSKHCTVCSRHFEEKDFEYKRIGNAMRRFLLSDAVPSKEIINNPCENLNSDTSKNCKQKNSKSILLESNDTFNGDNLLQLNGNSTPVLFRIKPYVDSHIEDPSQLNDSSDYEEFQPYDEPSNETIEKFENSQEAVKIKSSNKRFLENKPSNKTIEKFENSQEAVNIKSSNKRKVDEPNISKKRLTFPGNVNDLKREDFVSEKSWKIFKDYLEETNVKMKPLNHKVSRLANKVECLQSLLNHLKSNGILKDETCVP